jgi:HD superfamily phosphodiesterase
MRPFHERIALLQKHIAGVLTKLPDYLTYHNANHTMDVLNQSLQIARAEGVTDEWELWLLRTAALLHDIGFTQTYGGHEEKSCEITASLLPLYDYTPSEIGYIQSLIMGTKIPQTPPDKLGSILCDADLDYLGRDDFWPIAEGLRKEWLHEKIIVTHDQWMQVQIRFLNSHTYFTDYSRKYREPLKQIHLKALENAV